MPSPAALTVVVLALVYLAFWARIRSTQHADEPPVILSSIPFLSPIISVLRRRYKIYVDLLHQYKLPIYTLRLPIARLYIVNDSSLIPVIERQSKVIAFSPIEAEATANLLGMSEATNETLRRDPTGENGHFISFHHAVRPALAPGPGLDLMNRRSVNSLATSLDNLRKQRSSVVSLFDWVQHEIIMATTDAEYGPGNPFRDPEFERMWHKFESRVPVLSSNAFPKLLAPGSLKAREFLAGRFARYFQEGHYHSGSSFLHARHAHGVERGLTPDDAARGELGACLAILNNTVAAAYWMVYHIFSNPALLAACRSELEPGVRVTVNDGDDNDDDGAQTHTIDLDYVKFHCPILLSTLQEVFRYRGVGTLIIRRVLEDHRLSGRYLLKKGGIVLMPNSVQHFDPQIWGADVNEFNYRRFLKGDSAAKGRKRHNPSAFRIFGGGSTLCPGRHFANTEILAFAALMVLQFDLKPRGTGKQGGGQWVPPKTDNSFGMGVARVFLMPENDLEVELCARGDERQQWRVLLSESKRAVHTMAEDMEAHEKMVRDAEVKEVGRRESV